MEQVTLPTRLPTNLDHKRVLALMQSDKKRRSGSLEFALPKRIGAMTGESAGWAIPIPNYAVLDVLSTLGVGSSLPSP